MKDFFISYASTDHPWAEWIAWVLEDNGYKVTAKTWESSESKNAIREWRNAIAHNYNLQKVTANNVIAKSQNILVILSKAYLRSIASEKERQQDFGMILLNTGLKQSFIPIFIRVEAVNLEGIFAELIRVDLVDEVDLSNKSEIEAEQAILAVLQERPESDPLSVADAPATPEETIQVDASDNRQLKLERRYHTVSFFIEPLTDAICIEMMQIPAGTFLMGSPEDELERLEWEGPQHEVTLATFFMGKYPVTQAQWRAVAALPQVSRALELDPADFKGDQRPVEQVSWYDAVEFCDRLSAHTGREYRLPTEAEWEYACRAGTTTPFHFGETITTDLANYQGIDNEEFRSSGSYGEGPKGEYREETTPIDHFGVANAFGLCDMHGNVWEWCFDQWHGSYEGAPINGNAWLADEDEIRRVLRGGSWTFRPRNCRSADRFYYTPGFRNYDVGFRVVCSTPTALSILPIAIFTGLL